MKKVLILIVIFTYPVISSGKEFKVKNKSDSEYAILFASQNKKEGVFLDFFADDEFDEKTFELGYITNFVRYSSCYRKKSCWMVPSIGNDLKNIPIETQFLLIERDNSEFLMLIPLVDNKTRCSLRGSNSRLLELVAETGDTLTKVDEFSGLYLLAGDNPQDMIKQASSDIQNKLKTFKLRSEKKEPWIVDYFGWCTWNALYLNLSKDTLAYAMKNFNKKEIPVRYMIIDGGWQSNKNRLLDSFDGDVSKFPGGIEETIVMLKNEFKLDKIIIWQALWGMFMGLDPVSFSSNSEVVSFLPPLRMDYLLKKSNDFHIESEATVGPDFYPGFLGDEIHIPSDFSRYYNDYFFHLRKCGADGVKVDAMTWIEATGNNRGGRVKVMNDMMIGLQSSVNVHFNNELINCSSCSNDYLFNTLTSNLTRSSGDFFPEKPETHGFHIYTNAHTSFWMGEIVLPDWDMFQSGHESGAFHAAARAISGGPVYTTEVIGTEDKDVLKRLMTSGGRLPRCQDVGRVCTESLFTDPANNEKAVKIYNINLLGGIVGAFNCSYNPNNAVSVSEEIKATDIENLNGEKFAVYRFSNGEMSVITKTDAIPVKLPELGFDLFTYVPVKNGFAPIGIIDKYNPSGMITGFEEIAPQLFSIRLMDGGRFCAWSQKKPKEIFANAKPIKFSYQMRRLVIDIPLGEEVTVSIKF